ncbi:MAG TPA: hypothetical protein VGL11_16460 [Candidatus Binatia bacterium]
METALSVLWDYFYTVFFNGYGILLVITAAVDVVERTVEKKTIVPIWVRIAIYAFVFILANVLAYKDLKEKYDQLARQPQKELEEIKELKEENAKLKDNREFQRLALKPNLASSFYYNENGAGFIVNSVGLGPAIIKSFVVKVDDVPQRDWREVLNSVGISEQKRIKFAILYPERQLPSGADVGLLWLDRSNDSNIILLIKNLPRIRIEICYCALYGDCWMHTDRTIEPTRVVSSCPSPKFIFKPPPIS